MGYYCQPGFCVRLGFRTRSALEMGMQDSVRLPDGKETMANDSKGAFRMTPLSKQQFHTVCVISEAPVMFVDAQSLLTNTTCYS
jgi:hypothetical protein